MTDPERERMTDEQIAGVLASMTEGCECTGPMGHVAMVTCNTRRCMACEVKDIITQLRADLAVMKERAEKAAEAERLREALETLRPKVLQHDPEYNGQRTNGPMPKWNGMLKMIDNALAGKE